MPIAIMVAPPRMTISQGRTFMVIDQRGEINPSFFQGVTTIGPCEKQSQRSFLKINNMRPVFTFLRQKHRNF